MHIHNHSFIPSFIIMVNKDLSVPIDNKKRMYFHNERTEVVTKISLNQFDAWCENADSEESYHTLTKN